MLTTCNSPLKSHPSRRLELTLFCHPAPSRQINIPAAQLGRDQADQIKSTCNKGNFRSGSKPAGYRYINGRRLQRPSLEVYPTNL